MKKHLISIKTNILPALLIFLPAVVFSAAPSKINYQGRLLDVSGVPIDGGDPKAVNFGFFRDEAKSQDLNLISPINTQYEVIPVKGFFSIAVDVKSEWFVGGDVYMQVSVEGDELGPPQLLVSSPYALSVSEGSIGVNELKNESVTRAKIDPNELLKIYKTADGRLVLGEMLDIGGEQKLGYKSAVCRESFGSRYLDCAGTCRANATNEPDNCELNDTNWIGSLLLRP
ncbi:MAG: hypothetical protein IPN19_02455 [Elusimicrobia bacterium]|nr:hypothetical protein [Elusimicrobiota bacterium]